MAGKGVWYTLHFTQWDLPILTQVKAYEGSSLFLSLNSNGGMSHLLQGDQEFWKLVHRAAKP